MLTPNRLQTKRPRAAKLAASAHFRRPMVAPGVGRSVCAVQIWAGKSGRRAQSGAALLAFPWKWAALSLFLALSLHVFHLIRFGTYFVFELRSIILNGASAFSPQSSSPHQLAAKVAPQNRWPPASRAAQIFCLNNKLLKNTPNSSAQASHRYQQFWLCPAKARTPPLRRPLDNTFE